MWWLDSHKVGWGFVKRWLDSHEICLGCLWWLDSHEICLSLVWWLDSHGLASGKRMISVASWLKRNCTLDSSAWQPWQTSGSTPGVHGLAGVETGMAGVVRTGLHSTSMEGQRLWHLPTRPCRPTRLSLPRLRPPSLRLPRPPSLRLQSPPRAPSRLPSLPSLPRLPSLLPLSQKKVEEKEKLKEKKEKKVEMVEEKEKETVEMIEKKEKEASRKAAQLRRKQARRRSA